MALKDACDGRVFDQSYMVFARMVELSGFSINIRHKEIFLLATWRAEGTTGPK